MLLQQTLSRNSLKSKLNSFLVFTWYNNVLSLTNFILTKLLWGAGKVFWPNCPQIGYLMFNPRILLRSNSKFINLKSRRTPLCLWSAGTFIATHIFLKHVPLWRFPDWSGKSGPGDLNTLKGDIWLSPNLAPALVPFLAMLVLVYSFRELVTTKKNSHKSRRKVDLLDVAACWGRHFREKYLKQR